VNIVLITNTYLPHVGGVARSVAAFREAYGAAGHEVLVVAPAFPETPEGEVGVLRVPAIQNFNASDFSVALPLPAGVHGALERFAPDIIHSQHPFLLGMTAIRAARTLDRPLVFTHHTLYEEYTHYVPADSPALRHFVIELATAYGNLADLVIAPSESIRDLITARGVTSPVQVIPTGVDVERFAAGDGSALRRRLGIPADAFVVGHMGRLAQEKNIPFLADALCRFLAAGDDRHCLVVGDGDAADAFVTRFREAGLGARLHRPGVLEGQALVDALAAMDLFAFASLSETQGMVLTEAMAAGAPVVALEAPGVREVVRDGHNGHLVKDPTTAAFAAALTAVREADPAGRAALVAGARETAQSFSMTASAAAALRCYGELRHRDGPAQALLERRWEQLRNRIRAEVEILRSLTSAGDGVLENLQQPQES
jgi:glycosyltransferase involved in cell wall biosynthesis